MKKTNKSTSHLKRIAPFGFAVDHFHNLFINSFSSRVPLGPIISSSATIFRNKDVLWIVKICIRRYEDVINNLTMIKIKFSLERNFTHPWFQINKDCTRNIVFIVSLIKEDVLTVTTFSSPLLKYTIFANSMFCTQTLPEDSAHWSKSQIIFQVDTSMRYTLITTLSKLDCYYFTRHGELPV